jgi:hypothetical protein
VQAPYQEMFVQLEPPLGSLLRHSFRPPLFGLVLHKSILNHATRREYFVLRIKMAHFYGTLPDIACCLCGAPVKANGANMVHMFLTNQCELFFSRDFPIFSVLGMFGRKVPNLHPTQRTAP